jgi:hypothetical protein
VGEIESMCSTKFPFYNILQLKVIVIFKLCHQYTKTPKIGLVQFGVIGDLVAMLKVIFLESLNGFDPNIKIDNNGH